MVGSRLKGYFQTADKSDCYLQVIRLDLCALTSPTFLPRVSVVTTEASVTVKLHHLGSCKQSGRAAELIPA